MQEWVIQNNLVMIIIMVIGFCTLFMPNYNTYMLPHTYYYSDNYQISCSA